MKCVVCGKAGLKKVRTQLEYNGVAVVNADVSECPKCGERYEGFDRVEQLSETIAHHIARRVERLTPAEIRFLRKYLGYSGRDFARFLGVTPETVSRWESSSPKPMPLSTEKLLRYMTLNDKPVSDYGLDQAGSSTKASYLPEFKQRNGAWVPS
jgi:putative zinc finger/helix-turn-helix YgiT family protein